MAKWFIIIGIAFLMIGILLHFAPNLLSWFGKLPGDIRYEGENSKVFIPITSMIIISILLSFFFNFINK